MKPHRVGPVAFLVPIIFCASLSAQTDQPFAVQVSGFAQKANEDFETLDLGVEGQIRWTRGAWSLGAGVQYTSAGVDNNLGTERSFFEGSSGSQMVLTASTVFDYDVSTLGLFLEPKFVVLVFMDRFGLYASGRVAVFRMTESALGTRHEWDPVGGFQMMGGWRAPEVYSPEETRTGFGAYLGLGLLVRLTSRVNLDLGATGGGAKWGESAFSPYFDPNFDPNFDPGLDFQGFIFSQDTSTTLGVWVGLVIGIG